MYLSNKRNTFADNSRVEPTIVLMETLSFSLKLFSGHFYGQSFIKTVRGPLLNYLPTYPVSYTYKMKYFICNGGVGTAMKRNS